MRIRIDQIVSTYLQVIGGIVTLLMVLAPKWGPPGDFYLGFPWRFYVTQDDVAYSAVDPITLLLDLAVVGIPIFAIVFGGIWLLGRPWRMS